MGAIIQVLVFATLPFMIYRLRQKNVKGFLHATGIYKASASALGISIVAGLIIGAIGIPVLDADPGTLKIAI